MNKSFFDNEWYDHTTLHPMGLVAIVVLGLLLLVVQRRYSFWPILVMACFVAPAQRIVVAGLDFNLLRVMVLFGWIRVASRVEWVGFRMTTMDWLIVAWAVSGTAAYSILNGTAAAFIYKLGSSFDAVGMYFLCRMLVRDWTDVRTLATGIALTAVPVRSRSLSSGPLDGMRLRSSGAFPNSRWYEKASFARRVPLLIRFWRGPSGPPWSR